MPPESQTAIVRLLGAIAALLLILVMGLAVAGLLAVQTATKAQSGLVRQTALLQADLHAMRQSIEVMEQDMRSLRSDMAQVRASMAKLEQDLEQTRRAAKEASDQLAARQKVLDQRLVARSRKTLGELRALDRRRDALSGPPPWGTFSKLDRMIGLQQALADAILLMNEHLAETQAISAHEIRPLPLQRSSGR